MIGGEYYTFAVRGDGQTPTAMVPGPVQRKALDTVLGSLKPEFLMLPDRLLQMIPPHAYGFPRSRETFKVHTGLPFDPIGAAETSADITLGAVLQPERAARLVDYHSRDKSLPGLDEVIGKMLDVTWKSQHGEGYRAEVQRAVDMVVLYDLMQLAAGTDNQNQARAIAFYKLGQLKDWLSNHDAKDELEVAHEEFAISEITRFLDDPKKMTITKPVDAPAGAPIGMMDCDT